MSTANLTPAQLSALLAAENALTAVEMYLPLAERGHRIDFTRLAHAAGCARIQLRNALYAVDDLKPLYGIEGDDDGE